MKVNICITLLLALSTFAHASFTELTQKLNETLNTVSTEKGSNNQSVKENEPGILLFTSVFVNSKGESETTEYIINMADVDVHLVNEFTSKDIIYVQVKIKDNQKFIKTLENGELEPYTNVVKINATDIDNARAVSQIIKDMIPLAADIQTKRINTPTYEAQLQFLIEHVTEVNLEKTNFKQSFRPDENKLGLVVIDVIESSGKAPETKQYILNLADLNENAIFISVKSKTVSLNLETVGKKKLIMAYKNQEQSNFVDDLTIVTNNVNEARDLSAVLKMAVPIAKQKVFNNLPTPKTRDEMVSLLNQSAAQVTIGADNYQQTFTLNCFSQLKIIEKNEKSSTENVYEFNFSSLNEHILDYKISGKKLGLEVTTNQKEKLIKHIKDGELSSYKNDFTLVFTSNEEARIALYTIKNLIAHCRENAIRLVPTGSDEEKIAWLKNNIVDQTIDGKTQQQAFGVSATDPNKLEYKITTFSKSSSTEMLYEFNLADLDPNSISYKISGKSLSVYVNANFKSKIIKNYKNGEVGNYVNSLQFYFNDVETASNAMVALKELIENKK